MKNIEAHSSLPFSLIRQNLDPIAGGLSTLMQVSIYGRIGRLFPAIRKLAKTKQSRLQMGRKSRQLA